MAAVVVDLVLMNNFVWGLEDYAVGGIQIACSGLQAL